MPKFIIHRKVFTFSTTLEWVQDLSRTSGRPWSICLEYDDESFEHVAQFSSKTDCYNYLKTNNPNNYVIREVEVQE